MTYTVIAVSPDRRRQRRLRGLTQHQATWAVDEFRAAHPGWSVLCQLAPRGGERR